MATKRWLAVGLLSTVGTPLRAADALRDNAALAVKAEAVFGKQAGQSFDAQAVKPSAAVARTETVTVTLAPGKGAELQAELDAGQGMVFHWSASADVAMDLHGERTGSQNEYTSYDIEAGQRQGAGTFVAPFAGTHGWFWKNRSKQPVMVTLTLTGFHKRLVRHGLGLRLRALHRRGAGLRVGGTLSRLGHGRRWPAHAARRHAASGRVARPCA